MSWKNLATVKESKKGDLYFEVEQEVTLKPGQRLFLQPVTAAADAMLNKGSITQEQYEEKVSRIPGYFVYNIVLPPPRD